MTQQINHHRPHTTVVLAASLDGKIADCARSPARFSSSHDQFHLETQIAQADGVLFGAATLRAYGTTRRVSHAELLQKREQQGKPLQPVQIVCSRSANLNPNCRFFQQPIPRWLLTTPTGAQCWGNQPGFERILAIAAQPQTQDINWSIALKQLASYGIERLAVLGGGELVASLLAADCIDEVWLTVCPLLLGGTTTPTPVAGQGFSADQAPRLELLSAETIDQEVFLHYRLRRSGELDYPR